MPQYYFLYEQNQKGVPPHADYLGIFAANPETREIVNQWYCTYADKDKTWKLAQTWVYEHPYKADLVPSKPTPPAPMICTPGEKRNLVDRGDGTMVYIEECSPDGRYWMNLTGWDVDKHGCKGSAGYTWCETKQKCVRTWEEPCPEGPEQPHEPGPCVGWWCEGGGNGEITEPSEKVDVVGNWSNFWGNAVYGSYTMEALQPAEVRPSYWWDVPQSTSYAAGAAVVSAPLSIAAVTSSYQVGWPSMEPEYWQEQYAYQPTPVVQATVQPMEAGRSSMWERFVEWIGGWF